MKVGIIGAGSIGLLFAASLAKSFEVTLYTRTTEQANKINQNGILVLKDSKQTGTAFVHAVPFTEWIGAEEITVITVKQYQLPAIIDTINYLPPTESLLFLQNGMGHLKLLESLRTKNVFVGTVEHGALRENLYTVRHNGAGNTNVAVFHGDSAILNKFIASTPNDFPVLLQDHYYPMLLKKLMVNAVINPLTAILGVKNGSLVDNSFYLQAVTILFAEIASILNLDPMEGYLEQVIEVCQKTAENRSSMLKDMEAGRLTEVDAILGYLLDEAKEQQKLAPLLTCLYCLIKGKELDERGKES
ncbi:2-dehydropantoate 2-reductase [Neobacillus niacini]|uniref:2-dehydropantoate 2-reductase n=1 Tax=Neobacillus niacini TaxID=86668 RepID=UPI0021CB0998|nr:2-dehydropantoate 2-reductase [Neobacillus niacini]MCM3768578.1 2-dehydropantoate 2-reductase [Neobacillus niacini]